MYALKRYRVDGEVLFAIIHSLSNGKSDRETKAQLGMSNRSFYEKKVLAINLLSFILWGYSTLTILEGVSAYPLSKKDIQMLEQRTKQKKNDTAAEHF